MKRNFSEIIILYDNNFVYDFDARQIVMVLNSFFKRFKDTDKEVNITFLKYSDVVETIVLDRPASKLKLKKLEPKTNGASAVIDCTAETIVKTGERYAARPCEEHPENVIFLLTVYGQDNASKHFTYEQLNHMICHQKEIYNWNFFLLTDNYKLLENIAIDKENAVLFDYDDAYMARNSSVEVGNLIYDFIHKEQGAQTGE